MRLTMLIIPVVALALVVSTPRLSHAAVEPTHATVERVRSTESNTRVITAGERGFSPEELQELEVREAEAQELENYEGGVVVVIGSGIIVVALLVVVIVLLVD